MSTRDIPHTRDHVSVQSTSGWRVGTSHSAPSLTTELDSWWTWFRVAIFEYWFCLKFWVVFRLVEFEISAEDRCIHRPSLQRRVGHVVTEVSVDRNVVHVIEHVEFIICVIMTVCRSSSRSSAEIWGLRPSPETTCATKRVPDVTSGFFRNFERSFEFFSLSNLV